MFASTGELASGDSRVQRVFKEALTGAHYDDDNHACCEFEGPNSNWVLIGAHVYPHSVIEAKKVSSSLVPRAWMVVDDSVCLFDGEVLPAGGIHSPFVPVRSTH